MTMRIFREGHFAGFLKYILFSLLGLSIVGLVFVDIGSQFNGDVSGNRDVAMVEGRPIALVDFDQTLRRFLEPMGVSPQQAYQIGYTKEILAQEVLGHLAMIEAERLGVHIGNDQIKSSIAKAVKPILQEGQTLQQAFDMALQERRMTEKQFVKGIRKELTSDFVVKTVQSGFSGASNELAEDILAFQTQTRDVEIIVFKDSDIKDVKPATDEQLKNLYESFKNSRFSIPEYRTFKLGIYEPAQNEKPAEVTDEEISGFYNENIKNFEVSEQKILTQALLTSEDEANKILQLTQAGKTLEDAFKEVKEGKTEGLTPNMRLETSMMFPEMRKVLENASVGGVVGPLKTPLGVHVIRLDGSVPPMTRPLQDVKEAVRKQISEEKKMQGLYDISAALEDHFLQGGTIADAKSIVSLKSIDLPALDSTGMTAVSNDAFAALGESVIASKPDILKTGFEILQDDVDHTRIVSLPDGSFIVVELVNIEPESFKPYESVRTEIEKQFVDDQKAAENSERVAGYIKALKAGEKTLQSLANETNKAIQKIQNVSVSGALAEPLNDEIRPSIFKEPVGSYLDFKPENAAAIVFIRDFKLNPLTEEQKKQVEGIRQKLDEEMKNEAVLMYLQSLSKKYEARINETLLTRAYSQQTAAEGP